MKRVLSLGLLCLLALSMTLLVACNDDSSDSSATASITTVRIGALLPLTGSLATSGANYNSALNSALADVNRNLENSGTPYRLQLVVRDTASTGATALTALQDLAGLGIRQVVGPVSSAECQAILGYAQQQGILLMALSATLSTLAQPGDNLMRLIPPDAQQAAGTAALLAGDGKTVLLPVWRDDDWGRDLKSLAVSACASKGISSAAGRQYTEGAYASMLAALDGDVAALIAANGATKVAVLLISFEEGTDILAQAASYPNLSRVAWYGAEGITNRQALLDNSVAAAFATTVQYTGSIFSLRDEVVTTPKIVLTDRSLREAIKDQAGHDLLDDVFSAYDALWLYMLGLKQNNWSSDIATLLPAIRSVAATHAGLIGPLALDANDDLKGCNYAFYTVKNVSGSPAWSLRAAYSKMFNTPSFRYVTASALPGLSTAPTQVTIGALLNLTGTNSEIGLSVRAALQESLKAVNLHLSQNGYPTTFALDIRDIGVSSALDQLRALNVSGVKVVIGPLSSNDCAAVLPYAQQNGMTLISPTSTDVSLAIPNDPLFRFVATEAMQSSALAQYAAGKGIKVLVPLARNDSWGFSALATMRSAFLTQGGSMLPNVTYDPAADSHAASLQSLDSAVASALSSYPSSKVAVFLVSFDEGVQLLKEASAYPNLSRVTWYCFDALTKLDKLTNDPQAAAFASARGLTGIIYDVLVSHGGTPPDSLPSQITADKIVSRLGSDPSRYAYLAWDAFQCAAQTFLDNNWSSGASSYESSLVTVTSRYIAINGFQSLDANGDEQYGHYAFFQVVPSSNGYTWNRQATFHFHPGGSSATWFSTP